MKPMLEQCRAETERLVEEKSNKLLEKVWPNMVLVSNVLGKIVDRFDEEDTRNAVGAAGAASGAGGVTMVPEPVSISTPGPSTAGGSSTVGLPQPPTLLTSLVNISSGQVQQQLLKIIGAGGTAQVTSPTTPTMGVPAPQQQQTMAKTTTTTPVMQQQQMPQPSLATQVVKTPVIPTAIPQQVQQQQQQLPCPPVPLPVAVPVQVLIPTTGTAATRVLVPHPPPVTASPTGPTWVSLPVQQEQLARLVVQDLGAGSTQGVKGGGVPTVTQQQQQQQHPPAQQPQLQQQHQGQVSGSGSTPLP